MVILSWLFCSGVAFCISAMIHVHSFFYIGNLSDRLMTVLGFWSLLIMLYPALCELKYITRGFSREDYIKLTKYLFPKWVMCIFVILLCYALANAAYYFIYIKPPDNPLINETDLRYFKYRLYSSFWMAQHFLIFTLLWGIRCLKKSTDTQINAE